MGTTTTKAPIDRAPIDSSLLSGSLSQTATECVASTPATRGPGCRICGSTNLTRFLSLGDQPHCNRFLREDQLDEPELIYPLDVAFCNDCTLVQLEYTVSADVMFSDYVYVSGTTRTLTDHFRDLARDLQTRYSLTEDSLIADVGSNDGTFLKGVQELGVRGVGIEPATNIAELARQDGVDTVNDFMSVRAARTVLDQHGKADVITAAGVFYHIPDLDDFMGGVCDLLTDDGVFVVQSIYIVDMVENNHFDNIYHEHLCYYGLTALVTLFDRFDLEIVDAERTPIHGGSFIIHVRRRGVQVPNARVQELLDLESKLGYCDIDVYHAFAKRVEALRAQLVNMVGELKAKGKTIACYGAPAKGNTLLNYCGFTREQLDFAIEKNALKCGLYTPGSKLPVYDESDPSIPRPDVYLLLPWNFGAELLAKEADYREAGGKFIVPIPTPELV